MLEIKKSKEKFYIGDNEDNPLGEITLSNMDENTITIEHTIVKDELKGQGAAKQLVKKVVDFAREENKKVIPVCTYAKSEFERNKEYEDVLKK